MNKWIMTLALATAAFSGITPLILAEGATPPTKPVVTYTIDGVHSSVIFRIKHANVSYTYGRFNDISGSYSTSNGKVNGDSVTLTIKADSVDTGNEKRDEHLRKPDFFSAKEFPTISFKGASVDGSADKFTLKGTLSLHGVSKEISIPFEKTGEGKNRKGQELQGFEGVFTIQRSDFNMKYGLPNGAGDDVRIIVSIEAIKS